MEEHKLFHPIAIGGLRALAEVAAPANDGEMVEKAGAAGGVVTP